MRTSSLSVFFFLMIRRPPRSTLDRSSAASDVYKRQILNDNYSLYQNFPNPFNPTTIIKFNIPNDALILLKIYDVLGSEISTLVDGYQTSGNHSIRFDASHLSSLSLIHI